MTTEAGRRLLDDEMHIRLILAVGGDARTSEDEFAAAIAAIEAEARADERARITRDDDLSGTFIVGYDKGRSDAIYDERARIAARVRELPQQTVHSDPFFPDTFDYQTVALDAVLAIVNPEAER